jgi:ribonuclease III
MYNPEVKNTHKVYRLVDWQTLQQSIGIYFSDITLLQQAFQHSSFCNENPVPPIPDNERLEFLGDSVLSFIVAEKIYQEFPDLKEGELTKIRISLVREDTLAQISSELQLGIYLQLGKGEETSGGRERQSNLANTLEALIGAIYLDQGIAATKIFILNKLNSHFEKIKAGKQGQNYKAKLQEFTQAKYKQLPVYHLIEASGPDHNKNFVVEVMLGDEIVGKGTGKTKKSAEMKAALSGCEKLINK